MFYIDKHPILANDLDVLTELKNQLHENGIERFQEFRVGPQNIQFNCPIHGEGQERKPSCGVLTQKRGETEAGTVHCFTCNYTATLEEMVSHCFGYDDFGAVGKQWLIQNFMTVAVDERKEIQLDVKRGSQALQTAFVDEETLEQLRYYHPYMYQRKLTDEVIERFDVGYDKKDKCVTFPVRDENGKALFIAKRSVKTKYFSYPPGVNKPVYGLFEIPEDCDEVIICESVFNALTCYVYGKVGVALLGLGTDYQYKQLQKLNVRKFITAFDPDPAGILATERLKKNIKNKLITTYDMPDKKDVNDLTEEEFNNLKEYF